MLSNPNDLTAAQQIFAVFYAVFFGTMLQTVGARGSISGKKYKSKLKNASLNLFDTPNAWAIKSIKFDNKPLWRFILSVLFLNILPGIIFALIFRDFYKLHNALSWLQILVIVWISLTPQYIYRLFYALLASLHNEIYLSKKEYKKFNEFDIAAHEKLWEERLQFESHGRAMNHIAFPVFFFFPMSIILYNIFLLPIHTCIDLFLFSWLLLGVGSLLFLLAKREK